MMSTRPLERWSRQVPIWLLSNHRHDWLVPRLERFGVMRFFERVIFSDMMGVAKPDPEAYRHIVAHLSPPSSALFVDDQSRNVAAAAKLGLQAVHAGVGLAWIATVDNALRPNTQHR